ncbi:MAG: type II secretion system protein M [Hahellaceae bacterium]|nr:type II secretion system protein M [Hahellaceae bacterium]
MQNELNGVLKKASGWFHGLSHRDQLAVKALAAAVAVFLLYAMVWQPAADFRNQSKKQAESAYDDLKWMRENEGLARQLGGGSGGNKITLTEGQSLLSVVSASARTQNIELQRFEPKGDDKMNIWLDKVEFNRMMLWLENLNKTTGVSVEQISVDKTNEPGIVTARLSLTL